MGEERTISEIEQILEFAQKFDNAVVFAGCRLKRLGAIIERKFV